jgi:regulator of nonsense transcripts 3
MATTAGQLPMPRDQTTNGILPVTASQTAGNASKASANKSAGPRLKVVIRRLAAGLTEAEFIKLLGNDWKLGQGRIDWFSYKPGKDSKEYVFPIHNCQVGR